MTHPDPFVRIDEGDISSEEALATYQKLGFLWLGLRKDGCSESPSSSAATILPALRRLFQRDPDCYCRHWNVENDGGSASLAELRPEKVFGKDAPKRFYGIYQSIPTRALDVDHASFFQYDV